MDIQEAVLSVWWIWCSGMPLSGGVDIPLYLAELKDTAIEPWALDAAARWARLDFNGEEEKRNVGKRRFREWVQALECLLAEAGLSSEESRWQLALRLAGNTQWNVGTHPATHESILERRTNLAKLRAA